MRDRNGTVIGIIFLLAAINHLGTIVSSASIVRSFKLGDRCSRDAECESSIEGSQCQRGHCRCLPFYAAYNGTQCLEATLLGQECLVHEQCTLKVANSACLDGLCGCKDGFLQFRRHTCLSPAKLGQVCYEHAHCRLWQEDSHCDFLIPNLFGRCQCTAPMRREGDVCRPDDLVRPAPLFDHVHTEPQFIEQTTYTTTDEGTGVDVSWLKNGTTQSIPFISTDMITGSNSIDSQTIGVEQDGDDAVVIDAVTETANDTSILSLSPTKTDRHEVTPVSLGLDCVSDLECRLADPSSRCIDGVCDCGYRGNASCSAKSTGCTPGTFQCRSSGACISWFFVCDGRPDCSDGSDEQCSENETKCPEQAFVCEKSKVCVSRAMVCDGKRDCPYGEDEVGCNDRRRCPEGAFRCNNGQCLPAYEFCNAVVSCRDGSDEPRGACRTPRTGNRRRVATRYCPFRCENGRCRSDAIVCSGRDGCGDGSDEKGCSVCRCSQFP
ncbi:low-density lipoprotein receptor-related protein 2 [Ceratina calcarata]|uniref:Low-density lipoprotein receptor-related protein 2 n=1 Tax=Ceratina calcarata TaxID=156304 RepID=A0AAJ7IYV5_9HYME|nr:low-density lipoprotein receptor-related protein 2 [Ceratina calcarata]